jgi:hypothetical protein
MSYLDLIDRVSLFRSLRRIDEELAERTRAAGCPAPGCKGPLHRAAYERKPRGARVDIPEEYRERLGLCCGWCRRRVLPPSCLFFGRRVYWGSVVTLVTAAVRGPTGRTIGELCRRFEVSRRTIRRWVDYFATTFWWTDLWRRLRGRLGVEVRDDALPHSLVDWFCANSDDAEGGLVRCLSALAQSALVTDGEG